MRALKGLIASAGLASALVMAGCSSTGKYGPVPPEYLVGTSLDRNPIRVAETTEYLEVQLNPAEAHLRLSERERIRAFIADYKHRGVGPLVMSLPKNHENEELAVKAVAEAREIAWTSGVDYQEISGSAFEANGRNTPIVLGFRAYKAIAPECLQKSAYDFSDASSNNDMPSLGCSVRTNMAAMISNPADLLGDRPLEPGDAARRLVQLELYRSGEATGAERSDDETGSVSTAVN
ncbi:CpaD family pilus assembly protein [Henriciella sp. AS95]|uniref:CpaD family pilus assembly protein n=1 Tax=Henriciella sp. AS95 TaxID=3135782 RepID=UPI00317BEB92